MDPEQESKTDATQPERRIGAYLRRYGCLALAFRLVLAITLPLARSL